MVKASTTNNQGLHIQDGGSLVIGHVITELPKIPFWTYHSYILPKIINISSLSRIYLKFKVQSPINIELVTHTLKFLAKKGLVFESYTSHVRFSCLNYH